MGFLFLGSMSREILIHSDDAEVAGGGGNHSEKTEGLIGSLHRNTIFANIDIRSIACL